MYEYKWIFCVLIFFLTGFQCKSQILTSEDSLATNLTQLEHATVISGYGQMKIAYDTRYKTARANLTRNVLFVGHKFSDKVYLFSEMELENARVEGGEPAGEISMEQLFLKFNINRDLYLTAGLFLPRIGIINENHLPTTYFGNDRPYVETFLIPSTWREIGIGLYGKTKAIPGFNYSFAILNGLNSSGFVNGSGIREGRAEGSQAKASNIALTGSVLQYYRNWRIQVSGYYGGSAGLNKRQADSLQLDSGPFGTPVILTEGNIQYTAGNMSIRMLGVMVKIPDAFEINRAYASNTPKTMLGGYFELAYDLLGLFTTDKKKGLRIFARNEWLDLNYTVPSNGIENGMLRKYYLATGINFQPVHGVVIKADYVFRKTGKRNPELIINPFPQALPYYTDNGFFNVGFGYSF